MSRIPDGDGLEAYLLLLGVVIPGTIVSMGVAIVLSLRLSSRWRRAALIASPLVLGAGCAGLAFLDAGLFLKIFWLPRLILEWSLFN